MWHTQFGFRSGVGTANALFLVRRVLERTWEERNGKAVLLALDWAKAFDSIDPAALCRALRRFGVPIPFVELIQNIYSDREFMVRDAGVTSKFHPQAFGIVQGCPLSPFLFVIVMTLLVIDARQLLADLGRELSPDVGVHEILYADDTLLIDTDGGTVQSFMECIEEIGGEYGLRFNLSKLEFIKLRCDEEVLNSQGQPVSCKDSMVYLGSLLSADGVMDPELSRRIGLASADFNTLCRVWGHSSMSQARKLEVFGACIVSKLVYGLHTGWLNKGARRRLDGFQACCLRRILRIPPACVSRVSNEQVRQQAGGQTKLSLMLLRCQLRLLGRIAMSEGGVLRDVVFEPGTFNLLTPSARRVGRPRLSWAKEVYKHACTAAGGTDALREVWEDPTEKTWIKTIKEYCKCLADSFRVGSSRHTYTIFCMYCMR